MKLFVREKIKIADEAEINLETVDRSGMLLPRKVNRNAQIVKRHRAIHEGNTRKNITKKSQIKSPFGGTTPAAGTAAEPLNDDLFIPYKKVSFLPAYFYKVFIKKKKPEPVPEKPGKPNPAKKETPAKPDPKKPPGKAGAQPAVPEKPTQNKAAKLMEELKQEKEDYN